jgi:hypothetical protein
MVVVLPAPLGPRKPCTSPAATLKSSRSRARELPKSFTNADARIAVITTTNDTRHDPYSR